MTAILQFCWDVWYHTSTFSTWPCMDTSFGFLRTQTSAFERNGVDFLRWGKSRGFLCDLDGNVGNKQALPWTRQVFEKKEIHLCRNFWPNFRWEKKLKFRCPWKCKERNPTNSFAQCIPLVTKRAFREILVVLLELCSRAIFWKPKPFKIKLIHCVLLSPKFLFFVFNDA